MAILQGNAKQGSTRGFYPRVINGSLRFNDDDSAYLSWTPDSAGNRKTWTFSCWVKRCELGDYHTIFDADDGSGYFQLRFNNGDSISVHHYVSSYQIQLDTNAVYRDPSAWYHIVVKVDTTQATASDRVKLYVNGGQVTSFSTATYPTQNYDTLVSSTAEHVIGSYDKLYNMLDGYMADIYFIDGQALTPSDFGSFKNGVWVAEDYAGTFGTNGFHLTFEDDTEVEAFNTVLYRGNGGIQSITGMGFQPDLLWVKARNTAKNHYLADSVRGTSVFLRSNLTNGDATPTVGDALRSFDNDGFTFGADTSSTGVNTSGQTYVAWGWKAGDSNVSNTDGSITSTVRANDTYGFSIVSYTGNATSAQTIGHGLSSAPNMIILKGRERASNWRVGHDGLTSWAYRLILDQDIAENTEAECWNSTAPTSSVFSIGNDNVRNASGEGFIAYCWAEKTGYSKFGSYTGNGSTTGPTVTGFGFKPAFMIIKRTDVANSWYLVDNTRDTTNPISVELEANNAGTEGTGIDRIDFNSDGFQIKTSGAAYNASGGTYIYAAFADTREAAFWLDQSGNDNDWQPVNLDHNDTVADSPTNNFATLNPLDNYYLGATFSDGNLRVATNNYTYTTTTMGMTSGQYYAEVLFESNAAQMLCGITRVPSTGTSDYLGNKDGHISYYNINGNKYINGAASVAYGDTYTVGDLIGIAVDMDAGEITFFKNGTSQGVITGAIDTSATYFFAGGDFSGANNNTMVWNFGQQPFKYDPPE